MCVVQGSNAACSLASVQLDQACWTGDGSERRSWKAILGWHLSPEPTAVLVLSGARCVDQSGVGEALTVR